MKKKILTYVLLIIETVSAVLIGVYSCIEGPTNVIKYLSGLLLLYSIIGISNLFRNNSKNSKLNIIDLIVSIIVIVINRESIGLVFGWEQCPMI